MAESRSLRFTGMNPASANAWPAIGHLKSDSFNRIATRLGIAPTTAGASAELVWFATNRHAPAGMRSRPAIRTLTPTARRKNITPLTPPQYKGPGLREISVYKSNGGPARSMYSGRKVRTKTVRSIIAQNSLESGGQRQVQVFNGPQSTP